VLGLCSLGQSVDIHMCSVEGLSILGAEGGKFFDPEADEALFNAIKV